MRRTPLEKSTTLRCRGYGRSGRCGRRGRTEIEIHGRGCFSSWLSSEVRSGRKTKHAGNEIRREAAHLRVVSLHDFIEFIPLNGDTVLGSFELRLQRQEVLICLQLRVTLNHDEQSRQRVTQLALGRLELFELLRIRRRLVRIQLNSADARARVRDLGQGRLLKVRGALNGVNQIRN